mgnify:CR=1 FL=1
MGLFAVALLAIVVIAGAGLGTMLRRGAAPSPTGGEPAAYTPPRSLKQALLGLYLSIREADVEQPVDAADARLVTFTVSPGETAATIGPRLEKAGLIRDAGLFAALVSYRGVDASLEAGDYELSRSMSMERIVSELQHGHARSLLVTIPEGWRMEQVAARLAAAGLGKEEEFLALMRRHDYPYAWLQDRPSAAPAGLEGFLFPDTYRVPLAARPQAVIDLMLANFERKVTPELRQALTGQGLSFYEAMVLASIVEREAVVPEERPTIAAVFLARLRQGMYLQADPTVSYAKGFDPASQRWWTPMLVEDSQSIQSPYNTFLHPGLTPGPICSPGLAAIEAVARPAATDYLFFVSRGDGSHAFAVTFEEHLDNLRKYQPQ